MKDLATECWEVVVNELRVKQRALGIIMFVNLVAHGEFEPVPAVLFRPGMKRGCHLDVGKLLTLQQNLRIWFTYFWPCVDKMNPGVEAVLPQQHGSVPPPVQGRPWLGWAHQDTRAAVRLQGWQLMWCCAFAPAHLKLPTCLTFDRTKASKFPGHLWRF